MFIFFAMINAKLFAIKKAGKNEANASLLKEMMMMMNTLSSSPKPPFQEKEKEEKGNAEMDIRKEADVVFVSSLHIAREEEVPFSGEILKCQPL